MPITPKQLEARKHHIGASDSPAIMGFDPFKSAADVFISKVYDTEPNDNPSQAIQIGNRLEDSLTDWASDKLGIKFRKNIGRVSKEEPIFSATPDAQEFYGKPIGLEAKTSGITNPAFDSSEWGEEGTDHVPNKVIIQVQHQMFVAELEKVYVPALIGGRGMLIFEIDRNETIIAAIKEAGLAFWQNNVLLEHRPDDVTPKLEMLKSIYRDPTSSVELYKPNQAVIVQQWLEAKTEFNAAKKIRDLAQADVINLLEDTEAGLFMDGSMLTYYESDRKGYTVEPTKSRTLRYKKGTE